MRSPLYLVESFVHHRFGVAMIAPSRDFLAAHPWIERMVGPLDFTVLHLDTSILVCNVSHSAQLIYRICKWLRF